MPEKDNTLLDLEEFDEKDLEKIRLDYKKSAKQAREDLMDNTCDTAVPHL
jgi:hypothetical protein